MRSLVITLICLTGCSCSLRNASDGKTGFPLAYEQDFEDPASISGFEFTDPASWFRTSGNGGGWALECAGAGDYQPKVRSPFSIALISDVEFADFVLEADLMQTGREYGHRDMCLFFSFTDSVRFYYVHMASQADPHAHNIFIVNDEPRVSIAEQTTDGIRWIDEHWHHVRLERITSEGSIRVYFDDMDTPIMVAHDRTFERGLIGFGSFDDSGKIDNIRIWSPDAEKTSFSIFSKK